MSQNDQAKLLVKVGIIAAFATLAFIGTTIIRIPIPATGGYFNLGDTFVMAAGLLYGPMVGGFVGLIGPTMADAIGFPQFILATAVVKGIEGVAVGVLAKNSNGGIKTWIALSVGIAILVGGYFVFEAFIYPPLGEVMPFFAVTDLNAAIAELFPNLLQGLFSAILAFALWRVFKGVVK
ncbi:MAG: ECF transporter S component [Gammaproteobacteria bacterium]|nr:ECF transporter S component [Gammaproteobacteria bacterium]